MRTGSQNGGPETAILDRLKFDLPCDLVLALTIFRPIVLWRCRKPARWAARNLCCGEVVLSCRRASGRYREVRAVQAGSLSAGVVAHMKVASGTGRKCGLATCSDSSNRARAAGQEQQTQRADDQARDGLTSLPDPIVHPSHHGQCLRRRG